MAGVDGAELDSVSPTLLFAETQRGITLKVYRSGGVVVCTFFGTLTSKFTGGSWIFWNTHGPTTFDAVWANNLNSAQHVFGFRVEPDGSIGVVARQDAPAGEVIASSLVYITNAN